MANEYTGNLDDLTPLQQQNLLAFRIRKLRTQQAHGDKVQIVTPESEVLNTNRPMALPLSDLNTRKQVVMKFDKLIEYPDGTKEYECSREDQPITDTAEDIIVVLKRTLAELENSISSARGRNKARKQIRKIEETATELEEREEELKPEVSDKEIGKVISRVEEKPKDKRDKLTALLDALLDY